MTDLETEDKFQELSEEAKQKLLIKGSQTPIKDHTRPVDIGGKIKQVLCGGSRKYPDPNSIRFETIGRNTRHPLMTTICPGPKDKSNGDCGQTLIFEDEQPSYFNLPSHEARWRPLTHRSGKSAY